jgi:hypothetical protein
MEKDGWFRGFLSIFVFEVQLSSALLWPQIFLIVTLAPGGLQLFTSQRSPSNCHHFGLSMNPSQYI